MSNKGMLVSCLYVIMLIAPGARGEEGTDRAAWLGEARFGVMNHYLEDWIARKENLPGRRMSVKRWNELVDAIDVEKLADQVQSIGANYQIFTIGQNSGFYVSPNPT